MITAFIAILAALAIVAMWLLISTPIIFLFFLLWFVWGRMTRRVGDK